MRKRQDVTKSRSGDGLMPMTGSEVADGCERWFADGHGEGRRGCRSTHGDVPIDCGRWFNTFRSC